MSEKALPLSKYTVLDLTAARAGPTAVRQLADWGAHVIKIEQPAAINKGKGGLTGAREGFDFQNLHRNKRGITINLKTDEGRELFMKLVKKADIVVENYRSAVKYRLGVDYEECKKVNPSIIYGSISGFGQTGPYGKRPGVDQIAQGMGGLMSITGLPGQGPVRVGIPICDLTAGIFLAQGILLALLHREATGEGQWVHTSLLEAIIQMLDFQGARWSIGKEIPPQAGNNHPTGIPTGVFPTSDGHINIAASGPEVYIRLCNALGKPELADDPKFKNGPDRLKNREELNELIGEVTKTKAKQEWIDLLNEAGVPCGPIYNIKEMYEDPQVQHLGIFRPVEHPRLGELQLVGQALNMTATPQPPKMRQYTPDLSEHTEEVLQEFGISAEEISTYREHGAI